LGNYKPIKMIEILLVNGANGEMILLREKRWFGLSYQLY